jgi:hypothetical protein
MFRSMYLPPGFYRTLDQSAIGNNREKIASLYPQYIPDNQPSFGRVSRTDC